jgi:hypothetical protein
MTKNIEVHHLRTRHYQTFLCQNTIHFHSLKFIMQIYNQKTSDLLQFITCSELVMKKTYNYLPLP